MLNQAVLVGRIAKELEVEELENEKKVATMTIAVPRSSKNEEGECETDFIDIKVWNSIATNVKEYCRKGDIVGVKGRVQSRTVEKDGKTEYLMEIIAEKVTFLSSKKNEE